MKKPIAYLLLFAYSTMLLKPVLPYVTDFVAHTFWYADHIATVHFENGKYHIHKEVTEAARNTYPERSTAAIKAFLTEDVCLTASFPSHHLLITHAPIVFPCWAACLHHVHMGYSPPPPKAMAAIFFYLCVGY